MFHRKKRVFGRQYKYTQSRIYLGKDWPHFLKEELPLTVTAFTDGQAIAHGSICGRWVSRSVGQRMSNSQSSCGFFIHRFARNLTVGDMPHG